MQLHFLIPDPEAFQSGGNRYNASLISALHARQVHVSHSAFDPDVYHASPDTVYVLDSIYFEQIADQSDVLPPTCLALVHHLNSMYPAAPGHYDRFEASVLQRCAGYIATSAYTREYLADRGLGTDRTVVIEPAVTGPDQVPQRTLSKIRALVVANCIPRKGILALLQALVEAQLQPFFELVIIGSLEHDPAYASACQTIIRHNPTLTTCVRLLGEQDDETLLRYYRDSNLFISPSVFETFGMAIQEALVYRMPALVHTGGNAANHIREGINGHVFGSHREMARMLGQCIEDPQQLAALHQTIRKHPPAYQESWLDSADMLCRFVETLDQ